MFAHHLRYMDIYNSNDKQLSEGDLKWKCIEAENLVVRYAVQDFDGPIIIVAYIHLP